MGRRLSTRRFTQPCAGRIACRGRRAKTCFRPWNAYAAAMAVGAYERTNRFVLPHAGIGARLRRVSIALLFPGHTNAGAHRILTRKRTRFGRLPHSIRVACLHDRAVATRFIGRALHAGSTKTKRRHARARRTRLPRSGIIAFLRHAAVTLLRCGYANARAQAIAASECTGRSVLPNACVIACLSRTPVTTHGRGRALHACTIDAYRRRARTRDIVFPSPAVIAGPRRICAAFFGAGRTRYTSAVETSRCRAATRFVREHPLTRDACSRRMSIASNGAIETTGIHAGIDFHRFRRRRLAHRLRSQIPHRFQHRFQPLFRRFVRHAPCCHRCHTRRKFPWARVPRAPRSANRFVV